MSFFGTVLTVLVTLLHIYVFVRIGSLPFAERLFSKKGIFTAAVVSGLVFWLSRSFGGHHGLIPVALEFFAMHWMGSVFLLAVGFFLADLLTVFGFLFRRHLPFFRTAGFVFGIFMVFVAHVQGFRPPVLTRTDVSVKNLPGHLKGTTIAVMADIHGGEMGIGREWIDARVRRIMAMRPGMIVLVGDIFERAADPGEMIPVMRKLKAPMGVWAVRGNHDSRRRTRRDVLEEIMRGAGIKLLENQSAQAADGLTVAGIDDLTALRRTGGKGLRNIGMALKDLPGGVVILLSHTPWMIDHIAASGVDLMISGHTHEGQVWPFNYLSGLRYPYSGGKYEIGDFTLLVNRGTGTWGPRMRLWKPGEISLITLH